ncbi:MAG: hypothetical protein FWE28_08805 [Oscillospiraceae bacterium]|nr:hypothetical protein [Oscillospiraceae bacterium]
MEKDILVREIVSFCLDYGVLIKKKEIERKIEQGLESAELIEDLYNTIFRKAKSGRIKDIERVKELLIELEKIRLDLEFKD